MRRFALLVLFAVSMTRAAVAGSINGTIQEDFSCPAANCTTSCVGTGGSLTISGYKDLSAWMVGQPDRLWLQKTDPQNNVSLFVLGVGDRCVFAGTALTIQQQPTSSSLGPPPTGQCVCIGNVCTPPGCGSPTPEVSPLK
jgi:hypothetical protein